MEEIGAPRAASFAGRPACVHLPGGGGGSLHLSPATTDPVRLRADGGVVDRDTRNSSRAGGGLGEVRGCVRRQSLVGQPSVEALGSHRRRGAHRLPGGVCGSVGRDGAQRGRRKGRRERGGTARQGG